MIRFECSGDSRLKSDGETGRITNHRSGPFRALRAIHSRQIPAVMRHLDVHQMYRRRRRAGQMIFDSGAEGCQFCCSTLGSALATSLEHEMRNRLQHRPTTSSCRLPRNETATYCSGFGAGRHWLR
jgi:hypothetical protein